MIDPTIFKKLLGRVPAPQELIAGVLGILIALAGVIGISVGVSQDQGSSSAADSSSVGQSPRVNDWTSRDDLEGERRLTWTSHEVLDGGKQVRIFFQAGTPSCVGIRTEVAETATTVNIKLFTGALPGTDGPCTREAALASAVVTLDNPVGARVITGRDLMGSLQLSS